MNLADIARTLARRWYLTIPLLILTVALAIGAFLQVKPTWERAGSLVLLPDSTSIPEGSNPYLYLSGLNNVADVLTRASGSQAYLDSVEDQDPSAEVEIGRDSTTSSPVVTITVSASSDRLAADILEQTVAHVTQTLDVLQEQEGLAAERRITIIPLSVDESGTIVQRTRLMTAGLAAAAGLVLVLLVPNAVEGLSKRRRRRPSEDGASAPLGDDWADDGHDNSDLSDPLFETAPDEQEALSQGRYADATETELAEDVEPDGYGDVHPGADAASDTDSDASAADVSGPDVPARTKHKGVRTPSRGT